MDLEPTYVLLYGGDTCHHGTRLGLESLLRLKELLDLIITNPHHRFEVLLAAGSHPTQKEYPRLKDVMAARLGCYLYHLKKDGTISYIPRITLIKPDVWNTSNESLATALFLETLGVKELLVVSSQVHERRIKYIWSLIGGFTIRFVGAPTRNLRQSRWYELAAMAKVYFKDRRPLQARKYSTSQIGASLATNY